MILHHMMCGEEFIMDLKGYIFDLDGVLVFTDRFHYQAWKQIADELGIKFDEKINNRLRGVSRRESLDIVLENYDVALSETEKDRLASEKNRIYRGLLEQMKPADVTDEVRDTLKKLKEQGKLLAIGSSSKNTKFILDKVGLRDCFDAVSDGTNISRSKPDPEVFIKAAEYLGLKSGDCAVIEDAEAGIDAAKAGGMYAVGIGEASKYEKTDRPITSFREILEL